MHACHVCHLLLVSPPPTTPPSSFHSPSMNVPTFDPSMSGNGQSSTVSFTGQDTGVSLNEGIETSYNQAAGLPSQSRRILDLEFIEMSDLLPDSWPEEAQTLVVFDTQLTPRRLGRRIIVQDLSQWIECFSRMAALWAYQASIVRAARNFEGTAWVAYDRQYRRKALARRDLNWSQPNSRLYNEAFTGRAKAIPRCCHCLSDAHSSSACVLEPHLEQAPPTGHQGSLTSRARKYAGSTTPIGATTHVAGTVTFAKCAHTSTRGRNAQRTGKKPAPEQRYRERSPHWQGRSRS